MLCGDSIPTYVHVCMYVTELETVEKCIHCLLCSSQTLIPIVLCTLVLEWVLQPKLASDKEPVGVILAVYTADDDCSITTHLIQ